MVARLAVSELGVSASVRQGSSWGKSCQFHVAKVCFRKT